MTDAESTPITGIGELTTNDGDDGTYAALNDAALVISGTGWRGPDRPRGRRPRTGPAGRTDLTNTPRWGTVSHRLGHS